MVDGLSVVHISTVHPVFDNRIFYKECSSLAENGWQVTLVATAKEDFVKNGVKVRGLREQTGLIGRFKKIWQAYKIARNSDANIIHLHDPELLLIKPLLRLSGKLVVYDAHEHFSQQILIKNWLPAIIRKPLSFTMAIYERVFIGRGPVIFAEDDYIHAYPYVNKYKVALNLPDLQKITNIDESKYTDFTAVGYLGGVTEARGCLKVLEALVELKKQSKEPIGYVCIGRFESQSLQDKMEQLGAQLDFYFAPGFMPFEDGIKYIARCHIGMALLDRTPNYIASYPTKIFEYMALGIPFIVSDFPINRKVVEDNGCGLLVKPESSEELNDALKSLILSNDLRLELGNNGAANSFRYDWRAQRDHIVDGYTDWMEK